MGFFEFQAAGGPPAPIEACPEGAQRWTDPATWNGALPADGQPVKIEAGRTIVLDCDIDVASLRIEGTLIVAARDTRIRAGWILVQGEGRLVAGTADHVFRQRLSITLCAGGGGEPHARLGSKFLAALDGGTIDLHGAQRASWVALGASVAPGHNTLRLAQPVDWRAGERIAVASGQDHALVEEHTIAGVGGDCTTLTLGRAVAHRHHGQNAPVRHANPGSIARRCCSNATSSCRAAKSPSARARAATASSPVLR